MPLPSSLSLPCGRTVPVRVRPSRGKSLRLRVRPDAVELAIPARRCSQATARAFLESQTHWIQDRLRENPFLAQDRFTGTHGWEAPLAGHIVPVVWHQSRVSRVEIVGQDDALHGFAPASASDAARRALVLRALGQRLLSDAACHLRIHLPSIPDGHVSRLCVSNTGSQWGSMSRHRRMSLALGLVGMAAPAVEYVVVHELCHQIHMDHSPDFWRQVRARCPGYKAQSAYIKRVGPAIHGLLARLTP